MNTQNLTRPARVALGALTMVVGIASAPVASAAAASAETPSITVRYGDLDLSHAAGAAILYSRVHAAANLACAQFEGRAVASFFRKEACVQQAVARAILAIDKPMVSEVYAARTGAATPIRTASNVEQ